MGGLDARKVTVELGQPALGSLLRQPDGSSQRIPPGEGMVAQVLPMVSPLQQPIKPVIPFVRGSDLVRIGEGAFGRVVRGEPIVITQPGHITAPDRNAGQL